MEQKLKIGDFYINEDYWEVKIVYFTNLEVCVEDKEPAKNSDGKFLTIFSTGYFLKTFRQIEGNRK